MSGVRCEIEQVGERWRVTVYRDGSATAYWFNTQMAAVSFADAQMWATEG